MTSPIAKGRVRGVDLGAARAVPGVLDILTHENVGSEVKPPMGPDGKPSTTSMESDKVWHDGQVVGIVVAETFEAAREAANKVLVDYDAEAPSATFDSPGVLAEVCASYISQEDPMNDPRVGDAATAFAAAPVRIDARYATPTQHHNPIELFTTTCMWDGPNLTIYEPT